MEPSTQASLAARRRRQQQKLKMKKRRQRVRLIRLGIAALAAVVLIGLVIFFVRSRKPVVVDPAAGVTVNGIDLTGFSWEEAMESLHSSYQWAVTVDFEGKTYEVEDYIREDIIDILNEIYAGNAQNDYTLQILEPEQKAAQIAETVSAAWDQPASDSVMTAYDMQTGNFIIGESAAGYIVDTEDLQAKLVLCFQSENYQMTIEARGMVDEPRIRRQDYQLIGTYTTTTTNNANRNNNVTLSCAAVMGTILEQGGQFSYNGVVGERTAEKGYMMAGAYANGEHVQELGGGVCQLSSTIYNAVVNAGLQVDERTGHSYEPSYVTPGEDATVSFEYPDFKFTNNSVGTVGLKTTFIDHTVIVEIYGVPVLDEGVTQYMDSVKTEDVPLPEPEYVLDETLELGTQIQDSSGKMGSKWVTNIVVERNGVVESETYLHTTKYLGIAPVIRCNPLPDQTAVTDGETPVVDGVQAGDGQDSQEQQKISETTGDPAADSAEEVAAEKSELEN